MKTILTLLLLATPALADHCRVVRSNAVVLDTGLTIVPYAVATPVAVVAPGSPLYSYRDTAQAYGQPQAGSADPDYAEFLAWKAAKANQVKSAVVPQTLLQQNCVKCHTENADAREHLDMSKELTSDQKLASIKALLLGSMPKGKTIDAQLRSDLAAELSGVKPEVSK